MKIKSVVTQNYINSFSSPQSIIIQSISPDAFTYLQKNRLITPSSTPSLPSSTSTYTSHLHTPSITHTSPASAPPTVLCRDRETGEFVSLVKRDKTSLLCVHHPSGSVSNIISLPPSLFKTVSTDLSRFGGCYLTSSTLYLTVERKIEETCHFTEGKEGEEDNVNKGGIWTLGKGLTEPLGELLTETDPRLTIYKCVVTSPKPVFTVVPKSVSATSCQPAVVNGRDTCNAYGNEPRRMGGVYCYQRPCESVYCDTGDGVARDLKYSRNAAEVKGRTVVFGREDGFQTHVGSVKIYVNGKELSHSQGDLYTLDDSVGNVVGNAVGEGFYLSVMSESRVKTLFVNVIDRTVSVVDVGNEWGNVIAAGVDNGVLALRVSNPVNPGGILLWDHGKGEVAEGSFSGVSLVPPVEGYLVEEDDPNQTWEYVNVGLPGKSRPSSPECIIILPPNHKNDSKTPLIVVPHGGPHSMTSSGYVPSYRFLSTLGYAILHVNYRGSVGFGDGYLDALPGNVGSMDVEDVKTATDKVAGIYNIDRERIGVCGGSHGGFLSGHMVGQYPEVYKVAAMRNPVTNIATMTTATDIRDWCDVEALGKYDFGRFKAAGKEELGVMWDKSPVAHASKVTGKVLVAVGMRDLRVPPSQGLEYYHELRSRGVGVKLLRYEEDSHPLSKVDTEADHWVNIALWFKEWL